MKKADDEDCDEAWNWTYAPPKFLLHPWWCTRLLPTPPRLPPPPPASSLCFLVAADFPSVLLRRCHLLRLRLRRLGVRRVLRRRHRLRLRLRFVFLVYVFVLFLYVFVFIICVYVFFFVVHDFGSVSFLFVFKCAFQATSSFPGNR